MSVHAGCTKKANKHKEEIRLRKAANTVVAVGLRQWYRALRLLRARRQKEGKFGPYYTTVIRV